MSIAIESLSAVSGVSLQSSVTHSGGSNAASVGRFDAMLQSSVSGSGTVLPEQYGTLVAPNSSSTSVNPVVNMIQSQDAALIDSFNKMNALNSQFGSMDAQSMTEQTISVAMQMTMTSCAMQTKMAVVQASRGAIETLMKNQ